jgi:hypothetical protein
LKLQELCASLLPCSALVDLRLEGPNVSTRRKLEWRIPGDDCKPPFRKTLAAFLSLESLFLESKEIGYGEKTFKSTEISELFTEKMALSFYLGSLRFLSKFPWTFTVSLQ